MSLQAFQPSGNLCRPTSCGLIPIQLALAQVVSQLLSLNNTIVLQGSVPVTYYRRTCSKIQELGSLQDQVEGDGLLLIPQTLTESRPLDDLDADR